MRRIGARSTAGALAFAGLLAGTACADYERMLDVAFPPAINGLPADGAWVSLPIGSWVTDGDVEATAMAACFARDCREPAAVATYRIGSRDGRLLDAMMADPLRLARSLDRPERTARRPLKSRTTPAVVAAAEPVTEGAYHGLTVRLARRDGSRPVAGMLVMRAIGDERDVVLVIAADADAAARVLRSVLAARA